MTRDEYEEHLRRVAGGPKSRKEIAEAERKYRTRIMEGQAEMAAAEYEAKRPPGAARISGLRASMPSLAASIADLPPEPEPAESNGKGEPPLDREMLKALGKLFVEVKKQHGRAQAWENIVDALMVNLHRLAPGYGSIKDIIGLARSLDEYSNPAPNGNGRKATASSIIRRTLLLDEPSEE